MSLNFLGFNFQDYGVRSSVRHGVLECLRACTPLCKVKDCRIGVNHTKLENLLDRDIDWEEIEKWNTDWNLFRLRESNLTIEQQLEWNNILERETFESKQKIIRRRKVNNV